MSPSLLQATTTLLLLLLSLSPLPTPATAAPVFDTDGDILGTSSTYYILPVIRGSGGGLSLASKNISELCPLYVIQEDLEVSFGNPVKFWPINSKQGFVSLSSSLNIDFGLFTICVQSTVWRITADEATGRLYVGTGGNIWDHDVSSDWFKIEKVEDGEFDYKIMFCPGDIGNGGKQVICGDVGVFVDGERRILGIHDEPLLVQFKKAESEV